MIWRGSVISIPEHITCPGSGRTNVGMTIMAIYSPGLQYPIGVSFVSGAANVVCNFIVSILLNCFSNSCCNSIQGVIPRNTFPFSASSFSLSFQRKQNSIRICNLIDCCRSFCTISTSTSRVMRISFKLFNFLSFFIYKSC